MIVTEPYGITIRRWKWKPHRLRSVRKRRLKPIRPRYPRLIWQPPSLWRRINKKYCERQIKLWKEGKLKQVSRLCERYAPANIRERLRRERERLRRERIKRQRIMLERIKKTCRKEIDLWRRGRLKQVADWCIKYMPADIRKEYCKKQIELLRKREVLGFPRLCNIILRSEGKIPKCRIVCRRVCA